MPPRDGEKTVGQSLLCRGRIGFQLGYGLEVGGLVSSLPHRDSSGHRGRGVIYVARCLGEGVMGWCGRKSINNK